MSLTVRGNLYTWGRAQGGRLGHGEGEQDVLKPKQIYIISQKNPVFISAGESHSAVITDKGKVYTWGSGGFGRLGHGPESGKECVPRLVEGLQNENVVRLSCGALHTLALTKRGEIYTWGQNKYGKLGIHFQNSKDGDVHHVPVRISIYKCNLGVGEPKKVKKKIINCVASFNHSVFMDKTGKLYTCGYPGKGLIGRAKDFYTLPLPLGLGLSYTQTFKSLNSSFV